MGARFQDLKSENAELRQALKAKFVVHHIRAGDLVVFLADQNPDPSKRGTRFEKSTIGNSFGLGYGCLENLRRLMCDLAGGHVGVLASSREQIDVYNLNRDERARLRATIDAIDKGLSKPVFAPLTEPLSPISADASVQGTVAHATAAEGLTPCKGCGLALEWKSHLAGCPDKQ